MRTIHTQYARAALLGLIALAVSGCTTLQDWSPIELRWKQPDAAVNLQEIDADVSLFRARYIAMREDMRAYQPDLSLSDWNALVAANDDLVASYAYVEALRAKAGQGEDVLVSLRDSANMIDPAIKAIETIQDVWDRNTHILSQQTRADYVTASGQVDELRRQISSITERPTPRDRTDMYRQLMYLAAGMMAEIAFP